MNDIDVLRFSGGFFCSFHFAAIEHDRSIRRPEEVGWLIERIVQFGWVRQHMMGAC